MPTKASYVINEVLDERGRYIAPNEFRWFMDYFKDRYDPRRLAFALMYTCGLRSEDGCKARLRWFSQDFKFLKMSQCKAHVRKRDGIIKAKMKPRFMPLPEWLSADLRNYILYRNMMGYYVGEELDERMLLFPKLRKQHMRDLFCKIRKKYGTEQKWLMDVWQIVRGFDSEQNLLWERKYFRIACHSPRASYCTHAYEVCNRDLMATKILSGHSNTVDLEKYVKISGIMEKKEELKDRFMNPLVSVQKIPLSKEQTTLEKFK